MLIDKYRLDRQDSIQAEFRIAGIKFFSPVRSAFIADRDINAPSVANPTHFSHRFSTHRWNSRRKNRIFFLSSFRLCYLIHTARCGRFRRSEERGGEKAVGLNPSSVMFYYNNFLWKWIYMETGRRAKSTRKNSTTNHRWSLSFLNSVYTRVCIMRLESK